MTRPTNGNLSDILTVRVGIGLILSAIAATFPENKQLIIHRLQRKDCDEEISQLCIRRKDFLNLIGETIAIIQRG
nr:hypothetical protein [Candidatus Hamiltonella defensa]